MNNILWSPTPEQSSNSRMALFIDCINKKHSLKIKEYSELHDWSINNIDLFWKAVSDYFDIKYFSRPAKIIRETNKINEAEWFIGGQLNYAENILSLKDPNKIAIEFFNELGSYETCTKIYW